MSISQEKQDHIRIGVDLGGTKIEFVALERDGRELHRHRIATPRFDYQGTVQAVAHAAEGIEKELGRSSSVGMGIPGTISRKTGLVKNANSTWLNGKPFDKDLSRALGREVRCANDANCLAVRMELPANGDTTPCRGCGRRNFPAQRVIAGGTAASKRGFPERAWKRITSAQQAFL